MTSNNEERRYVMALYYAHGRKDEQAATERLVHATITPVGPDPIRFAEFYANQWADYEDGRASYMPSVQDSWDLYRRSLK